MNTRKLFLFAVAALFGASLPALAQTRNTDATVARLTGAATLTLADGSTAPLQVGTKVPLGATITTGADGDVYLETHAGTVSVIKRNSSVAVDELSVTTSGGAVTEEKTTLNLKSGDLVALLNPAKRSVNNYQVRTPKGVAAARGTVFTVSYNGANYAIAVLNGSVQITNQTTGLNVTTAAGQYFEGNTNMTQSIRGAPLGTISGDQPFLELLNVAVATVAVAAANNIGGTTTAELASVVQTVVQAVPEAAPTIAALVAASAPSVANVVVDTVRSTAPAQSSAVEQAVQQNTPAPAETPAPAAPNTTTPQPIDPSTVSRSS